MIKEVIDSKALRHLTPVFGHEAFSDHEQVVFCHDKDTGLRAIIGIHNTVLGPALGGTRMWNYATEQEALNIKGIGPAKLKSVLPEFLEVIQINT